MLVELANELKHQVERAKDEQHRIVAELVEESRKTWRTLSESDRPRPFETFLIEWDSLREKAIMHGESSGNVTITWTDDHCVMPLSDLYGRLWLRIPHLPKRETE